MSSVAQLGALTFADNELNLVTIQKQTRLSPRGKRLQQVVQLACAGELIYSSTSAIVAKIQEYENALKQDNRDFRYTVGGVLSHSLLNSADCVSGVKVIGYSFPRGDAAQLATTRHFSFTLQATYDAPETDLVSWTETIEQIGNGGPKFFVVDTLYGPAAVGVAISTAVYFTRTGSAVGYSTYPDPPGTGPGLEFGWRRRIGKTGGRNLGNGIRFFTTRWSYFGGNDPTIFTGPYDTNPISQ